MFKPQKDIEKRLCHLGFVLQILIDAMWICAHFPVPAKSEGEDATQLWRHASDDQVVLANWSVQVPTYFDHSQEIDSVCFLEELTRERNDVAHEILLSKNGRRESANDSCIHYTAL
ncbi:MAG: hypothetical protein KBD16_01390 [Candidatus Pacebacteria bacterium]|nr:hypothetical protein [Candidatus Paceibacterota bacterium]